MKKARFWLLLVTGAGVATFAAMSGYYGGANGSGCARCHEIRPMVDTWAASTHRNVACAGCHGSSFTADLRMHLKNLERVWLHRQGQVPEQVRVKHDDVVALVKRCAACHAREHADWRSGPHGVEYSRIFLDEDHNSGQPLTDDCLRCHGMHYGGGIRDLVSPLDRQGPWQLIDAPLYDEPATPCLTCHRVHGPGDPLPTRAERAAIPARVELVAVPSLAFFDRRVGQGVPVAKLPIPAMLDGDRLVEVSPDSRQALCYQCHAPRPGFQVLSGDDRTATGVHEGISCLGCHASHGMTTRGSCAECHPRLSNCGLDVETMDTTFRSEESPHDIHSVSCRDCHPNGVPTVEGSS